MDELHPNVKTFICRNKNSKFRGVLRTKIINGESPCNFVFRLDSDNCFWLVDSNFEDLLRDGWQPAISGAYSRMNSKRKINGIETWWNKLANYVSKRIIGKI